MSQPTPPPIPPEQSSAPPPPPLPYATPTPAGKLSGKEQYNVVSDTIVGVNVRGKDNLYQAIACLGCAALGAAVAYFVADTGDAPFFAVVGAALGLIAGLFISGIVLMIYRGIRHARGRHD